ncbi:protein valois isoform X1 [Eurosta solidaginis]|uniref:protein valois isoform X1 n=1 Tax=Eurosta solidaginis TaxID=178769 RepID=UPI003530B23A
MFPIKHGVIYRTPEHHQPPDDNSLAGNTNYPNLNSRDYAKRPLNRHIRMHQAWECLSLNTEHQAVIATNKLSGREWAGSIWGFENIGDGTMIKPAKACYKLQCQTLISCLQFVANNIFLVAMRSGRVQVWSTRSEVRNPQTPYCMFLIGEKCEHMRPITCMSLATNIDHAVTGSKDGTLKLMDKLFILFFSRRVVLQTDRRYDFSKICKNVTGTISTILLFRKVWDMGCADLFSIHTFRYAHTDVVSDVATSNKDASVFATCSLDYSALLWDIRQTRPAIALCDNYPARFKSLSWPCENQATNENFIYLADECGFVHSIDTRVPRHFVQSNKCLNRPVHKITPTNNKLAIIGDTNMVKVIDANDFATIYTNVDSEHFVRDAVWRDDLELLTVGYEGKLRIHKLH